jgi:hypothetical protein
MQFFMLCDAFFELLDTCTAHDEVTLELHA